MPKKKWTKPKLIVLVRERQEELVLVGCKATAQTSNYGTHVMACSFVRNPRGACMGSCFAYGAS